MVNKIIEKLIGTVGESCMKLNREFILVEKLKENVNLIKQRLGI